MKTWIPISLLAVSLLCLSVNGQTNISVPNPTDNTNSLTVEGQSHQNTITNFVVFLSATNDASPLTPIIRVSGGFNLDGNMLNFVFAGRELPEPSYPESGAGIYGPARPGKDGHLIFGNLAWDYSPFVGGFYSGEFELTHSQIAQLRAGLWYVSVTSPLFPNGELRMQIIPEQYPKEPKQSEATTPPPGPGPGPLEPASPN